MSPDVSNHYDRARPVYEALARVGTHPTIGVNDYAGWYVIRDTDNPEAVEAGYPEQGSIVHLGRDLDTLLARIDRTLYAITTYKTVAAFDRWVPCKIQNGKIEWQGDKPTPPLEDLRAVAAWGDIDLADDLKPERGDLADDTQATIEAALDAYIGEYATLYGSREAVYALDSVGGAYIFGAPSATLPIAEHYDGDEDALGRVMNEFIDRTNEYLESAEERVNDAVKGASDVLDPDWVNNLNRQYKAPLSLHKDHDAVVTPLDTDAPDYTLTPLEAVDDALVDACVAWAEDFTADDHCDCVDHLVSVLWPDEYEDEDSWAAALDAWVAEERRREEEQEQRRHEALIQRERSENDGIAGLPITPHRQDVYDAIDNLDIEAVAEDTIVHQWTDQASGKRDTSGSGKRAFIPTWGPNANGTANYVNIDKGVWVDTGQNHHGTAVEMALIAEGGWTRGDIAEGEDWGRGVDALRDMGFTIPFYTPDANTADGEQMSYWALRKAALALEVLDEDDLEERTSDDGDPWLAIPDDKWDDVLEVIEDAGLEHGRTLRADESAEELDRLLTHYADEDARKDDEWNWDKYAIGRLLGEVDAETFAEQAGRAANVFECDAREIHRHRGLEQYRWSFDTDDPVNIICEDGKMWQINGVPLKRHYHWILNFELGVNAYLDMDDENRQLELEVVHRDGADERTVSLGVFQDPRTFDSKILAIKEGLLIKAGEGGKRGVLDDLNYYIAAQDAPVLQGTRHMGLHDDEWVIPDHSLTPDGWADEPRMKYVKTGLDIEKQFDIPTDRDEYDAEGVAEILGTLPKTRPTERLLPVLGWYYTAPFRPHIFALTKQFNHLNVKGTTGAGKSSTLRYLWRCFGMGGEPMSVADTRYTLFRTMSASNAVPMWYDEYKPATLSKSKIDRFHEYIRKAATGGVEQRGNPDDSSNGWVLKAPLIISGEEKIRESAEARRSVYTEFTLEPVQKGSPMRTAFKELVGDAYEDEDEEELIIPEECPQPNDHALAYFRWVTSHDAATVKQWWRDAERTTAEHLRSWSGDYQLGDLEQQGLQTVVFGWERYREFYEAMGGDPDDLPGENALDDALLYIANEIGVGGRLKRDEDHFIELASRAAGRGFLTEGQEYVVIREGTESEEVRLHLSKTFDAVSKYLRDHDLDEPLLSTYKEYRERLEGREDDPIIGKFQEPTDYKGERVGLLTGIVSRVAAEQLDFDPHAFKGDSESSDGAIPLVNLPEGGFRTVEVEVIDLETPAPNGEPGASGAVRDETGTVSLACWKSLDEFDTKPQKGLTYRFTDALVGEFNSAPQITIDPDITSVEPIQRGAGYTEAEDSGANEELSQKERIDHIQRLVIELSENTDHGAPLEEIIAAADEAGISESKAMHELGKLKKKGEVYEPADDHFRPSA